MVLISTTGVVPIPNSEESERPVNTTSQSWEPDWYKADSEKEDETKKVDRSRYAVFFDRINGDKSKNGQQSMNIAYQMSSLS